MLINGGGQTVSSTMTRHALNQDWARSYWRRSLLSPGSWWRAVSGRTQYRLLARVLGRQLRTLLGPSKEVTSAADVVASQIRLLVDRGVRLLFVCSEGDHAITLHQLWLRRHRDTVARSGRFALEVIPNTDHTFTFLRNQRDLLEVVSGWAAGGEWTDQRSAVETVLNQ